MKRASQKSFHFLYRTVCLVTGRWYIGIHSTDDMGDGYLGSGRQVSNSIRKHGKENHTREIIELCPSRAFLCEREECVVTHEMISDPLCMNLIKGGTANKFPVGQTTRDRMRLAKLGKKQSPETVEKRRLASMGRVQSFETREKLRVIARSQWQRRYAGDESAVGKRKALSND